MYYLARNAAPVPAEAPYSAHINEKQQWDYHQQKHQEALRHVVAQVDKSRPRCINPHTQSVQARTRRFCEDQRRAEIGRENRKLVEKLSSIAKHAGPLAPPPPVMPAGSGAAVRPIRPSAAAAATLAFGTERSRSLNDGIKRQTQKVIDQDNAHMVRRILSVKSTFDSRCDERDFQRHKRAVNLLQRMPEAGGREPEEAGRRRSQHPRSLPPLRPPRPSSNPAMPVCGLEMLMLPGDLRRSESGPGALDPRRKAASLPLELTEPLTERAGSPDSGAPSPRPQHTVSAPAAVLEAETGGGPAAAREFDVTFGASGVGGGPGHAERTEEEAPAPGQGRPPRPSSVRRTSADPPTPPPEEAAEGAGAGGGVGSSFPQQRDSETERRAWLAAQERQGSKDGAGAGSTRPAEPEQTSPRVRSRQASGVSMLTGMSSESGLQYTDDWESDSFGSTATSAMARTSLMRSRSSITSSMAMAGGDQTGAMATGSQALQKAGDDTKQVKLKVKLLGATSLKNSDWIGNSDPFCICRVPGKPEFKFQTEVVNNNLNPVWNAEFIVEDFGSGDTLDFSIFDDDDVTRKDLLGTATLTSKDFLPNGFHGAVPLIEPGLKGKGVLNVSIEVMGAAPHQPVLDTFGSSDTFAASRACRSLLDNASERPSVITPKQDEVQLKPTQPTLEEDEASMWNPATLRKKRPRPRPP